MINYLMNYNLKIYQNSNYFKYSIDSVLLAEFVEINLRTKNIIDLCTGNAPIPMILSTKFKKNIYGVEIQKEIYQLAKNSIELNNIKNVKLLNQDVKDLRDEYSNYFDIVTCNPPYFKFNKDSILNKTEVKSIARHEIKITLEDVFIVSSKILKCSGSLNLVHRTERLIELINLANKYDFGIRRLQFVYDNYESDCCFVLIECKYKCKHDLKVFKPIYIDKYLEEQ